MSPIQKRFLFFLGGCIPARLALTALAKYLSLKYLPFLGLITLSIAFGFIYLYFTGKRTTGFETQGASIWWMKLRIIHGLMYLLFSLLAFNYYRNAYKILFADTMLGLLLFIIHHYQSGNFNKLL